MLTYQDYKQLNFCATEVQRQGATPRHVPGMMVAWDWARYCRHLNDPISAEIVLKMVRAITLDEVRDFRRVPVVFANGNAGINADLVPRAMEALFNAQNVLTPQEFYEEFERIHPFVDGNGRVGIILYNYLLTTMDDPQIPTQPKW